MRVFVSHAFKAYATDEVRADLIEAFKWWKAQAGREFESPFFGKDAALISPKVGVREYALRHCHLIPLNNAEAISRWAKAFRRRSRKTSDRVLIYVSQGSDHYLIDVVDDPGAHEIMRMADKQGRSFMAKCAQEAAAFLDGQVELELA